MVVLVVAVVLLRLWVVDSPSPDPRRRPLVETVVVGDSVEDLL